MTSAKSLQVRGGVLENSRLGRVQWGQLMTNETDEGISSLPSDAIFLTLGIIATGSIYYFLGWFNPFFIVISAVTLFWSATFFLNLKRWMQSDIAMRSRMIFPKKTVTVLLLIVVAIGLTAAWVDHELSNINWR